jgi:hypothetical protein
MTVDKYRSMHRKCDFCKHCCEAHGAYGTLGDTLIWCGAKYKTKYPTIPRLFCSVFELEKEG